MDLSDNQAVDPEPTGIRYRFAAWWSVENLSTGQRILRAAGFIVLTLGVGWLAGRALAWLLDWADKDARVLVDAPVINDPDASWSDIEEFESKLNGQPAQPAPIGPKGGTAAKGAELHLGPDGLSADRTTVGNAEETAPAGDATAQDEQSAPTPPPSGEGARRAFQDGQ